MENGLGVEWSIAYPIRYDSVSNQGLLKKAASGVLAIFPCSRTTRTLRAKKRLRPCWTDFFEPTRSL